MHSEYSREYDYDSDTPLDEAFLEDWVEYDPEPLDPETEELLEGF